MLKAEKHDTNIKKLRKPNSLFEIFEVEYHGRLNRLEFETQFSLIDTDQNFLVSPEEFLTWIKIYETAICKPHKKSIAELLKKWEKNMIETKAKEKASLCRNYEKLLPPKPSEYLFKKVEPSFYENPMC